MLRENASWTPDFTVLAAAMQAETDEEVAAIVQRIHVSHEQHEQAERSLILGDVPLLG